MRYQKNIICKNGKECLLREAQVQDAQDYLNYFYLAHSQTDYLTTYPDESTRSIESTQQDFIELADDPKGVEICAFVDGKLVGSAGIMMVKNRDKTRHRCDFGISIIKDYWGLGIGQELTKACIECARNAGYVQMELEVVADNQSAVNLYKKCGFEQYGRNPKGFRNREGHWQELVLMRLEL